MKVVGVIPARMAASRFPGKPLAPLAGHPMIEHVHRRAERARHLHEVVLATCDAAIYEAVEKFGGRAVMTADTHLRCTDRVAEAAQGLDADIIVNIQGDEPLIHPDAIDLLCETALQHPELPCVNLANVIVREEDFRNTNQIKAVCDRDDNALYMSRQPIPTTTAWGQTRVLRQLGMIAFRKSFLATFAALSPTPLEASESIDMLRAIEHGYKVRMVISPHESFGVDTPDDLRTAETRLAGDPLGRAVFAGAGS